MLRNNVGCAQDVVSDWGVRLLEVEDDGVGIRSSDAAQIGPEGVRVRYAFGFRQYGVESVGHVSRRECLTIVPLHVLTEIDCQSGAVGVPGRTQTQQRSHLVIAEVGKEQRLVDKTKGTRGGSAVLGA